MFMTIDKAAQIIRTHPNPQAKQDLFVYFEQDFCPTPNREFQEMFAGMCGFVVAKNIHTAKEEEEECRNV